MKRRIQNLTVEPTSNGYILSGTASDDNGQNPKPMRMIATNEQEVIDNVTDWVTSVFENGPTPTGQA